MKALIGSVDGVPQEVAVVSDDFFAEVVDEIRRSEVFDRVDIVTVSSNADLLAYVRSEVKDRLAEEVDEAKRFAAAMAERAADQTMRARVHCEHPGCGCDLRDDGTCPEGHQQ